MGDLLNTIETRRSIRAFQSKEVPKELLEKVVTAGTYAATGRNAQSPIIIAVTDKELRDRLSVMNAKFMGKEDFDPFYGAPDILIVLADKNVPTHIYDGSLVLGNMMLEAHELGLGSCWIHRAKEEFDSEEGREILKSLGIEGEYEGIGHLAIGYPVKEDCSITPRKENYVYWA